MLIKINKFSNQLDKYKTSLNELESLINKYYQELFQAKIYWKNSIANYFFDSIEQEKKQIKNFVLELIETKNIYEYILNSYSKYDNKLEVNLENIDKLINKIEDKNLEEIFLEYERLEINFDNDICEKIKNQQSKIKKAQDEETNYKNKLKSELKRIQEIEKNIKQKLIKITIPKIQENDFQNHELGNNNEVYFDVEQLDITTKKIIMYKEQIMLIFENIKIFFSEIKYNYISENTQYIEKINLDIENRCKIIKNNIENNIKLLNNNISSYKETELRINKELEDIPQIKIDFDINQFKGAFKNE